MVRVLVLLTLVVTLCACGVRSPADEAPDGSTVALEGLSLRLPMGWDSYSDDIGPWLPEPAIWAANIRLPDRASGIMAAPYEALPDLPPRAIVLMVAATIEPEPCPSAPLLQLRRRDVMTGGYEGQPAPHVSSGSTSAGSHGRCLFAQAWFGANEPSDAIIAEVNRVLDSVEVEPLPPPGSNAEWRSHLDEEAGVSLRYPPEWRIAKAALMPLLVEPRELVSLGTAPLQSGDQHCPQVPANALDHLGPKDAFVSLLEFGSKGEAPLRPRHLMPYQGHPVGMDCLQRSLPHGFLYRMQIFEDHGRLFQVYVAIGESASDLTRRQTTEILDSITVD